MNANAVSSNAIIEVTSSSSLRRVRTARREVVQGDELMGWWSAQEVYEEARNDIETWEIYDDGCISGRGHRARPGVNW